MILSIAVIIASCIIISLLMIKRVVIHSVIIKMVGVILIAFSVLEYAVKFSTYIPLEGIEQTMYTRLMFINLTVPQLAVIMNIGVAFLLLSSAFFLRKHISNIHFVLLIAGVVFFFTVNYPRICERLYILSFKSGDFLTDSNILAVLNTFNLCIVAGYAVLPYAVYGKKCIKTNLQYKKQRYLVSLGIIGLMDILIYGNFMFNEFKEHFIFNLNLIKYPLTTDTLIVGSFTLIYTSVTFLIVFFAILIAKPFGNFGIRKWYMTLAEEMSATVSMILHGYKNAFVAIEMFADEKNQSFLGDSEKRLQKICEIARLNEGKIKDIINIISMQNKLTLKKDYHSLNDIINNAVASMRKDSSVNIEVDCKEDYTLFVDKHHFAETLLCILNNSYEALTEKDENKSIVVRSGSDGDDVYIEISDNGCGMKNTKKIFNPFYSLKMGGKNFGIGLTYAKQIVEAHGGVINIKSRLGEGTSVQILILNGLRRG